MIDDLKVQIVAEFAEVRGILYIGYFQFDFWILKYFTYVIR